MEEFVKENELFDRLIEEVYASSEDHKLLQMLLKMIICYKYE